MKDVLGAAILDYYKKNLRQKLWIHNKYGRKEEMPVEIYFRTEKEMPLLELKALQECKGSVLDIGAGAGSHALALQKRNIPVTAMDISEKAVKVMKARGVKKAIQEDIWHFNKEQYDTMLLLMNGIGLTANLQGLQRFLTQAKNLLAPNGQLLFDSSDVAYLYKGKIPAGENYYGEIAFQYEYKGEKSDWFTWLYVDQQTLKNLAKQEGWQVQILFVDEQDQYLARLQPVL